MLLSGYTQLTYIESRGSGYVITNLKDTDDYDEVYLGFKDFASQTGSVMGAISSAATGCEIRWNTTSGVDYNNIAKAFGYRKNSLNADDQPTGNGYYRFYFSGGDAYIDLSGNSQVKLNGTSTLTGYKIALFGRNTSNGGSVSGNTKYKLTSFWAKKNGVYVVNYVPCKRDSDSSLGIYDLVNNEFISGGGTLYGGYEINTSVSPSGSGSISITNSSDTFIFTATPNTGYQFDHFDVNGTTYTTNPLTLAITQNTTITAYFVSEGYTVTCTISPPTAGAVSGTGTYQENAICTLTPMHNSNNLMRFSHWLKGGIIWSYENLLKVQVTEDVEYTCKFVPITWQTPITDRSESDLKARNSKAFMNIEDWNRIEMNCKELQSYSTTINRQYNIYGHYDIPTIEDVRRIRKNILDLAIECFGTYELPMVSTHYSFFNALEKAELDIYNYYNED